MSAVRAVEDTPPAGSGHPDVKRALSLVKTADPAGERLLAEGIWPHEALLDSGTPVEAFLVCPEAAWSERARALVDDVAAVAEHVHRISARTLARLAQRDRPDGLVSIARPRRWRPEDLTFDESALVLVADGLETPGNLGTLVRTLDACRGDALVVTDRRTTVVHPKVFRASHGTSLSVPWIGFDDTDEAAEWLQGLGFTVLLADNAAPGQPPVAYQDADWSGRTAVVLGNERYGVSSAWRAHSFGRVAIPMLGRADSLNAAVAGSVLLYEARRAKSGW
ncbi:MAG: TrmH family RNA methyltransferase [Nocardioidaceae bacterium]